MQEQRAPKSQCFTKLLRLCPSGIQDEEATASNTCYSITRGKAQPCRTKQWLLKLTDQTNSHSPKTDVSRGRGLIFLKKRWGNNWKLTQSTTGLYRAKLDLADFIH